MKIEQTIKDAVAYDARTFAIVANETNAVILDVRHQDEYALGHIPKSIFIGIDGDFASWVRILIIDIKQPLFLVTPVGREEESITQLARAGYDNTLGYLKGGFETWKQEEKEYDTIHSIAAVTLEEIIDEIPKEIVQIFDVRKEEEYIGAHIVDGISTPLNSIHKHLNEFPTEEEFYIHSAGGYRSMIAASILKSHGYHNVINILGGFDLIKTTTIKTTNHL